MRTRKALFIFSLMLPCLMMAQTFHVKGRVVNEDGDSVKYVTVRFNCKETILKTGLFDLLVSSNDTVSFSTYSLIEKKIKFHSSKSNIKVKLKYPRTTNGEPIYYKVDQMPEFPGGNEKMFRFLKEQIKYPSSFNDYLNELVIVEFLISRKGKISEIVMLKGKDQWCNNEALRIVRAMPDWIPGKKKGKPVNVRFTLPIRFLLK